MSFEVLATSAFERKLKKLAKRHRSLKVDLANLIESLAENPAQGVPLGRDCYKLRFAIKSKGGGKSGGGRLITLVKVVDEKVFLLDIYDKADQESISQQSIDRLIVQIASNLSD